MSKKLSELLDEPEVVVESVIKKLEHISGWGSTDVRLLSEINNKIRSKLAELNLDPDDTTGPELYHALIAKFRCGDQELNLSSGQLIKKLSEAHKDFKVYSLKKSTAKEILRQHPPKKMMKLLNYRSIDSMLKKENIAGLYAALPYVESHRWLNVFWKDLAKVTPSDFETQKIEIVKVPVRLIDSSANKTSVTSSPLLGSVTIWSDSLNSMELCMNIAEAIHGLRTISARIKLSNVEADFGKSLVEILKNGSDHPFKISVLPISWQTIFHHYGLRSLSEHTEFFGPHLLHEDIKSHNSVNILAKISPVFEWWQGLEYAAKKTEEGVVSFNLSDIIANKTTDFGQRNLSNFRNSLWHEFVSRYLNHPSVEQHFMQKLEPQTVPVIDLRPSEKNPEKEIARIMEAGV
jgi:hypothetical protein